MKPSHANKYLSWVAAAVVGGSLFCSTGNVLAQGGVWTNKAPMPTPRNGLGAASINGIVYAVGGSDGGGCNPYSTVEAYDPATDTWTTKHPMPTARYSLVVVAVNQILYAIGGGAYCGISYARTVEAYDPATDSWTTKASMPAAANRTMSGSVINGIIYIIDGYPWSTVYAYDPATDTWTTKSALPSNRISGVAGSINGIMYYVGGYNPTTGSSIGPIDAYNPVTDSWTQKASIPTPRGPGGAGVINGKLYAVGGCCPYTAEMDAYDPATDTWTTQTPMPTARTGTGVAVVNGVLYAVGGNPSYPNLSAANEAFTPSPVLTIAPFGNQSVLFWPASGTNYILQSTTNLASPNWLTASDAVPVIAFTVSNTSPARFFRLQQQQ